MKTFDARAKMSIKQSNVKLAENHELNQLGKYKLVNEIILNTILPSKYSLDRRYLKYKIQCETYKIS